MKPDRLAEKTKKDLLEIARELSIPGRSAMSKGDLIQAITASKPSPPKRTSRPGAGRGKATAEGRKSEQPPKRPLQPPPSRPREADPREAPSSPRTGEDSQPPFEKKRPPIPPRPPREGGPPTRRSIPSIDPAMKLSRVEEIRMSSPGRKPGPPGQRGAPRGPRPQDRDRHGGRLPMGRDQRYRPQEGPRQGRDWDRDRGRDWDRGRGRDWDRGRGRDRGDRRDQRSPQSRGRPDQRSMQSREHDRRSREERRPGSHGSSHRRSREEYRIDTPSPASIPSRLIEKFAPRHERPRPPIEPGGAPAGYPVEVPETYGVDRLALMARDPFWLHAYWEVTPDSIDRARDELGEEWDGHRWILRIQVFRPSEESANGGHFDVDLNPEARNWYLRLPHANCSYEGTIGVITREGNFYPFARSGRVYAPPDSVSADLDEQWTTLPEETEEIYALSGGKGDGSSSADVGHSLQPGDQEAFFSGMLGSMGGGAMGAKRPRGFWLQVNTELVLYGATQPDAQLTVQGRSIRLRPDGTFTLRFQLPDGVQEIPCVAKSADGASERKITPVVSRQTSGTGETEAKEAD